MISTLWWTRLRRTPTIGAFIAFLSSKFSSFSPISGVHADVNGKQQSHLYYGMKPLENPQ